MIHGQEKFTDVWQFPNFNKRQGYSNIVLRIKINPKFVSLQFD